MARPRIASSTPRACAGCYGQYPGRVHVDFASAINGAQLDPERPRAGHVEWVVLCENCVRNAAALLPDNAEQRERLEHRAKAAEAALKAAQEYSATLEAAIAARPEREHAHPTVTPAAPKAPRKRRYEGRS